MALGIPSIVSPVGVNNTIVNDNENGLFAETIDEWECAIEKLIQNKAERKRIGMAGKETIRDKYSVLAYTAEYIKLFS